MSDRRPHPFLELQGYRSDRAPTRAEVELVKPHYMALHKPAHSEALALDAASLGDSDIARLLEVHDWRAKSVAAYFAAVRGQKELEDALGRLLRKSQLVYAGRTYALALASFGSDSAVPILEQYLDVYLRRPDLWFDQADVLSALISLDELHGRTRHQRFLTIWEAFVADKPNWSLERSTSRFATDLELLLRTRGRVQRLKAQT